MGVETEEYVQKSGGGKSLSHSRTERCFMRWPVISEKQGVREEAGKEVCQK